MSIAIKISDKEHGKVRFATTVVVTGKAGADEVYVGYNDALLRLSVDKETMDKLRVGDKLYYHEGVLSLEPEGTVAKAKPKAGVDTPVKSHPAMSQMSHRFPQR